MLKLLQYFLGSNEFAPSILSELEKVSQKVSHHLSQVPIHNLVNDIFSIQDLDWSSMFTFFIGFSSEAIDQFEMSNSLQTYLKSNGYNEVGINNLEKIIGIALLDIYTLVLLKVNFGINEQRLKGILFLNMYSGSAKSEKVISRIVYNRLITPGDSNIDTEVLLTDLTHYSKHKSHKDVKITASCPFYQSVEKDEWVENIWKFFETELIPALHKKIGKKGRVSEDFYTGNLV